MPEDPGSQESLEIERASVVEVPAADLRKRKDPGDAGDEAGPETDPDTTDMNAVGDDGQVFGG